MSAAPASDRERFDALLALDHSRQEPWGSRHGLAFAAYVLQHPAEFPPNVQAGCWQMLYRVYVQHADPQHVVRQMRERAGDAAAVPKYPGAVPADTRFDVTIQQLGDFDAETYPVLLDVWCIATLAAYGVRIAG